MGHALAKPNTETSETLNTDSRQTATRSSDGKTSASLETEARTDEGRNVGSNNKKAASMTTKKHEAAHPVSIESGTNSFRLLNELHSDLRVILELLEKHDVRDFRLEKGEERIALKRGKEENSVPSAYPAPVAMISNGSQGGYSSAQTSAPQVSNVSQSNVVAGPAVVAVPNKSYKEITSPMVGTFYRRPAVDADAYVEVGDMVKKGDVLCIVEAMKLMNEIESEMSGKVVEICLEDAQMVEYGEVLFRIEPV